MALEETKCWKSPLRKEIIHLIKQRKSDRYIEQFCKEAGDPITRQSVAKFRKFLKPDSYLKIGINEAEKTINAVKRHAKLVELMEARVLEYREREQQEPDMYGKRLDEVIDLYNKTLNVSLRMKQDIGIAPSVKNIRRVVSEVDKLRQAREKILKKKDK